MLRTLLLTLSSGFLAAALTAQEPPKPPDPKPPEKVEQEPKKQDPAKQDPKEKDPAPKPGDAKPGDAKPGEDGKTGETGKDGKTGEPGAKGKEDEVEIDLPEDVPLPESADPADLRAMRSARDMLMAERRMRNLIKEGKLAGIDKLLTFEEISSWPYEDALKGMPKAVKELDDKKVLMTGFMLPIDEVENIKEFLLVQSLWACCYGQPPDINGIVRVVMKGDRRVDYQFDPIQVQGTFQVEATLEDGYCIDIFQLEATKVSLIK